MRLDRKRLDFLVRVAAQGPGLTVRALAEAADVSTVVLAPGYVSEPTPETIGKIARGFAKLLRLRDEDQLLAWLHGETDPALQAYLSDLVRLRECTSCRKWFPDDQMIVQLSRCRPCHRDDNRDKVFRRRIAKDPELAQFYRDLEEAKPTLQARDPELYEALEVLRGQAITRPKVARVINEGRARLQAALITTEQVLQRWVAVGLPLKLLFVAVSTHYYKFGSTPRRRRRRGATPSAASKGSAPSLPGKGKKKGRRGRPPVEAAGELSRRRRPPRRAPRAARQAAGGPARLPLAAGAEGTSR